MLDRFPWLLDKLQEVSSLLAQLRDSGHLEYQSGSLLLIPEPDTLVKQVQELKADL